MKQKPVAGKLGGMETTPEDEIRQLVASVIYQWSLETDSRKVVVGLLRPIIEFRTIKTGIGSEEFDLEERKRKFSKVRRFLLEVAVDPLFVRDCIKDPQTALKHADFLKKQRKAGIMASESQPVDEHDPLHFLTRVFDANVQVQRGDAPPSYGFLAKSMANMEEPERVVFARKFSEILKVVNREEDKRKKRPKRPRRLYEWWEPEAQPDYKPGQPDGTRQSEVRPAPSEKNQESSTAVEKNEDGTEAPRPVDPEPGAGVVSPDDGGNLRATSRMEMPGDALAPGEEPFADEGRCDEKP